MDLENQARVKEIAKRYSKDDLVVILGNAEAAASGIAAETVSNGDPSYAGPLAGVQLGLKAYHIVEPVIKSEVDASMYEEQVEMMEMVLDVEAISNQVSNIRRRFTGPSREQS